MHGRSIELFLANGTADSIVIATFYNWNGKAIKIPRIEVRDCNREDLQKPGVYFLFCKDEDNDMDSVYIGEAENVKDRLIQHLQDASAEKEKYYWNTAVIFTGDDLDKALIRYLEDRLVKLAKDSNRYEILTKNTYKKTTLKESKIAAMEEFLDNIKVLINALGYKVLEPLRHVGSSDKEQEENLLYLKAGSADAVGAVTTEGFVVLAGARINEKMSEKSLHKSVVNLRNKHFDAGHINENFVTTEDILFSSSSAAADFVTGYSVSGPAYWKDKNGKTLKEIESK